MVVHLFLNNNKALDFLPINSIKNGGITVASLVNRYNTYQIEVKKCLSERIFQTGIFAFYAIMTA